MAVYSWKFQTRLHACADVTTRCLRTGKVVRPWNSVKTKSSSSWTWDPLSIKWIVIISYTIPPTTSPSGPWVSKKCFFIFSVFVVVVRVFVSVCVCVCFSIFICEIVGVCVCVCVCVCVRMCVSVYTSLCRVFVNRTSCAVNRLKTIYFTRRWYDRRWSPTVQPDFCLFH